MQAPNKRISSINARRKSCRKGMNGTYTLLIQSGEIPRESVVKVTPKAVPKTKLISIAVNTAPANSWNINEVTWLLRDPTARRIAYSCALEFTDDDSSVRRLNIPIMAKRSIENAVRLSNPRRNKSTSREIPLGVENSGAYTETAKFDSSEVASEEIS